MTPAALELMRLYNSQSRYMVSNDFYSPFHLHRMSSYFPNEIGKQLPLKAFTDVHLRNAIRATSEKLGDELTGIEIDMSAPENLVNAIQLSYAASNRNLMTKIDLDLASLGYQL